MAAEKKIKTGPSREKSMPLFGKSEKRVSARISKGSLSADKFFSAAFLCCLARIVKILNKNIKLTYIIVVANPAGQ